MRSRHSPGAVVNGENVDLVFAYYTINNAIRPFDDFADGAALEFGDYSSGLWEVRQAADSPNQPCNDD